MPTEHDAVVRLTKELDGINLHSAPDIVREHQKKSFNWKTNSVSSLGNMSLQQSENHINGHPKFTRVSYTSFSHSGMHKFPAKPPRDIFHESKEVALFTNGQAYTCLLYTSRCV